MKITKEHYSILKSKIAELPRNEVLKHKSLQLGKDIDKRFRWDLFHKASLSRFAVTELYHYVNDDHIDTALKNIIKELEF